MSNLTTEELQKFAETYEKIRERVKFIAEARGRGWEDGDQIKFDNWDPVTGYGFEIKWEEWEYGDREFDFDFITAEDLLALDEKHLKDRAERIALEEAERIRKQEREERIRFEVIRERELQQLRDLKTKYPDA